MTARLASIHRFPVKSIGGETLAEAALTPRAALPGDRRFALLHQAALHHLDGGRLRKWLPKSAFVRGAAAAPLQAVKGGWDSAALHLTHPDLPDLRFDPMAEPEALAVWVAPLWADSGKAPPARLVEVEPDAAADRAAQALTDVKQPWVSILSLSSLAALEGQLGRPLGRDRWRGNLWIDGWAPYAERDLRLNRIRIGEVELKLTERIGRCAATSADTDTGHLDGDMPADLERLFDHSDFGIYAEVRQGGTIRPGDPVEVL